MSYFSNVAFLTGSVGTGEWIVLFVVVLIVVGPKRLPEIARKIGRTMEMFRRAADEFKEQLMSIDQEPRAPAEPVPDDYADPYTGAPDYPGYEDHEVSSESGADVGGADVGGADDGGVDDGSAADPSEEAKDTPKEPEVGA